MPKQPFTHTNLGKNTRFWQDSPSGYEKIVESDTDTFQINEEKSYSVEFSPSEHGIHEIHAYLYENGKLLSRDYDRVIKD